MHFRSIALAALLALAPLSARAADMPYNNSQQIAVGYYTWNGFYAGLNVGYGTGTSNWDASSFSVDPTGVMYGVTLGGNWQHGFVVYGIEADIGLSDLNQSGTCGGFSCATKNTWFGTARGRLGVAFGQFMPYVTGGAAFGDIKASSSNPAFPGSQSAQLGWTVGAGIEAAFMGNWTAKLEYLYVDLGTFDCGTACGPATPSNVGLTANIVRLGLNYRFSGPIYGR